MVTPPRRKGLVRNIEQGLALTPRDIAKAQRFFLTYGLTVTGLPVISVPCGFTRSGLPVGLQIVGRRRREPMVLRAAAAFEAAAPWAASLAVPTPLPLIRRRP